MAQNYMKIRTGVTIKPNGEPSFPENGDIFYDINSNKFKFYQNGSWSELGGTGTASPAWTKYTIAHSALQTAAYSYDIQLLSLPAKTMIHQVIVKHSMQFAGTGITGYTIGVGIASNLNKYAVPFDVLQAVGDTARSITQADDVESFGSTTSIKISATSTGAFLNQSTAGSVDVWILSSTLP